MSGHAIKCLSGTLRSKNCLLLHPTVSNTVEVVLPFNLPGSNVTGSKQESFCLLGMLMLVLFILTRPGTTVHFTACQSYYGG